MAGQNLELHLPDEARNWNMRGLEVCPECHCYPTLIRRNVKEGLLFAIQCSNKWCQQTYNTPLVSSSEKAKAAWRLACLLLKP